MLNKILPLIVLLVSLPAQAENGNFTYIAEGQKAPFKGTLLDDKAMSHILTLPEYYESKCNLETKYKLDLTIQEYEFKISDLNSTIVYLEKEKETITTQKDQRIELLEEQVKKNLKNDRPWYLAGGVAIGIGITIGIIKLTETPQ
tara:strand:- start:254 stop:688 length:435 start_codon:yes stop_codon:yes gene_type:complete